MDVKEYREALHEDMSLAAQADISTEAGEFLDYATKILIDAEEFDDFTDCYYDGISKRRANMHIDGYSFDETDGSCCVFIVDYRGEHEDDSIRNEEITILFKKIRYFIEESIKYDLYRELEESTGAYEFSKSLYTDHDNITKFRFFLLTDAYNKQRSKTIKDEALLNKIVELNVWDIVRFYDVVSSKTQKESVEIYVPDMGCDGIPCVKAVEYEDVIADIDVPPKYDDLTKEDGKPDNIISYTSYLAVIPGKILNELYLQYGSKLLEGNVRSFLSNKRKVNKGIQNTIKNYPEMFFAYNNGIAATATEIDTQMTDEGLKIIRIKDLQIVNGGQTTASIANTLLTARRDENIDISHLFVPMKVSVLEHSMSEKIIPKIAEYSNSQNPVDASDFFSNHPFHIRIEGFSRHIPAPAVRGNQYQQYWYYERTRGQYNQGKMKFKPKSSQLKQYELRYPDKQVIKMVDLAKFIEIYEGSPDKVSKGKQAIVKVFAESIKKRWEISDAQFNELYFKKVVALAIIFNETDEIVRQTPWWREKHSYKANVVAYAMSVLFNEIHTRHKDYEVDFGKVWNLQSMYPELRKQMKVLCDEVYVFITRDDRLTENVTEWCKKEVCWTRAKTESWTFLTEFLETLISQNELYGEIKEAKAMQKVANEVDILKFIMASGSDYWQKMLDWGNARGLLNDMEQSILRLVINMPKTGRTPSEKQAKVVMRARDRMLSEGMPLQF
jgi:hypothetical protein